MSVRKVNLQFLAQFQLNKPLEIVSSPITTHKTSSSLDLTLNIVSSPTITHKTGSRVEIMFKMDFRLRITNEMVNKLFKFGNIEFWIRLVLIHYFFIFLYFIQKKVNHEKAWILYSTVFHSTDLYPTDSSQNLYE